VPSAQDIIEWLDDDDRDDGIDRLAGRLTAEEQAAVDRDSDLVQQPKEE
jgi:hypothetical protein